MLWLGRSGHASRDPVLQVVTHTSTALSRLGKSGHAGRDRVQQVVTQLLQWDIWICCWHVLGNHWDRHVANLAMVHRYCVG